MTSHGDLTGLLHVNGTTIETFSDFAENAVYTIPDGPPEGTTVVSVVAPDKVEGERFHVSDALSRDPSALEAQIDAAISRHSEVPLVIVVTQEQAEHVIHTVVGRLPGAHRELLVAIESIE
jgi:hypothetical protein